MTLLAKYRPTDLGLERNLIVFSAIVADYLESLRRVGSRNSGLLRTALGASLRLHHVALIEDLLLLFGKKENFLALNARNLKIRHRFSSLAVMMEGESC